MTHPALYAAVSSLAFALASGPAAVFAQSKPNATQAPAVQSATKTSSVATATKPVDLNRASKTELKKVPGIGDAEAEKIIASRPFRTKAELVTRNIISESRYSEIRHLVAAKNPPKPKLPPPAK